METSFGVLPPRIYNHTAFIYRDSLYVFGGYGIEGEERAVGEGGGGGGERKKDASIGHRHSEVYEYKFTQNEWSMVKVTGFVSISSFFLSVCNLILRYFSISTSDFSHITTFSIFSFPSNYPFFSFTRFLSLSYSLCRYTSKREIGAHDRASQKYSLSIWGLGSKWVCSLWM